MERSLRDALDAAKQIQEDGSRCHIHIHSVRKYLTDPDGVSSKAAIDGLVVAGILPDDSAKYVEKVSYTQEKGKVEETIITLTWRKGDDDRKHKQEG